MADQQKSNDPRIRKRFPMPLMPFHVAPGLLVKAASGRHFSLMVFGFSQIAMDLEPLVHIVRRDTVFHGFVHTYAGATAVAVLSALIGRPICQWLLDRWTPGPATPMMNALRGPKRITWPAAIAAAFIGTYSHVFLDSIMHTDMQPLAPFSSANVMLNVLSVRGLHVLCVLSGLIGAAFLVTRSAARRVRNRRA